MTRVGVVLAVLAGCSQADPYTVDDYWREIAVAHCNAMDYCCTPSEYQDWWTTDSGTMYDCVSAHDAPTNAGTIREGIRTGKIDFNPDAARSCIIAIEVMPCSQFEPAIRYRESYCDPPLTGRIPDGAGPCAHDEECESRHCDQQICAPAIPPGGSCGSGIEGACSGPYRCQSNGTCALGLPPGASCGTDSQCADDWCKDEDLFNSGTCKQACDG